MESNRDEAERCIQIAAQALRDSKMDKAEKFLKKAEKLYPTQKAKGTKIEIRIFGNIFIHHGGFVFIDLLEKVLESAKNSANETDSVPNDGDSTRRRKSAASPSRKPQPTEPDYTPEQLQHVKRIKR